MKEYIRQVATGLRAGSVMAIIGLSIMVSIPFYPIINKLKARY